MIRNLARFQTQSGREVFTGQELLIKGAWETEGGVSLLTGSPGAPWNGFFRALHAMESQAATRAVSGRPARNERLAVASALGAVMSGRRAMAVLGGQGLQRAAEAVSNAVLLRWTDPNAGLLLALGDDLAGRSMHAGGDLRSLAEQVGLPLLEPSCPQEVKDWVALGFTLSREARIAVGLRLTPLLMDGGGTVFCYRNYLPAEPVRRVQNGVDTPSPDLVPLPTRRGVLGASAAARCAEIVTEARHRKLNRLVNLPERGMVEPVGVVAVGGAYAMLTQALAQMGFAGRLPMMKLGLVWPLDVELLRDFASRVRRLVIVEEGPAWVEPRIQSLLAQEPTTRGQVGEVFGKRFPDELEGLASGPLHPSDLVKRLGPLLHRCGLKLDESCQVHLERIGWAEAVDLRAPDRQAGFCPGCPHRDSSSVLMEVQRDLADGAYMLEEHQAKPIRLMVHGDTGCSSLMAGSWQSSLFQSYAGVGLAGGLAAGFPARPDVRHVALMGDATFFHSGWNTIAQAVETGQEVTFILLANRSAAMSGRVGLDQFDHSSDDDEPAGRLEKTLEAMMRKHQGETIRVARLNPADRPRYRALLERLILGEGVKVLIADKECGLQHHARQEAGFRRERAEKGFEAKRTHVHITESVCDFCLECTTRTGCQGLKVVQTDEGPKIQTDEMWCVSDGACHRIRACPSFCEVTVHRSRPPAGRAIEPEEGDEPDAEAAGPLPEPPSYLHGRKPEWRAHLAGVGGTGVGVATSVLLVAGHLMGYHVQYLDRTDPAPRTGSVSSQVLFTQTRPAGDTQYGAAVSAPALGSKDPTPDDEMLTTPHIPRGEADVIIGMDLVEVIRALDRRHGMSVFHPETVMAIQPSSAPTLQHLVGIEADPTERMLEQLASLAEPGRMVALDLASRLHEVLGTRQPLNIALLGLAFQLGWIPVSAGALEQAVARVIPHDAARALRALRIGRQAALDVRNPSVAPRREQPRNTLMRKVAAIRFQGSQGILTHRRWFGRKRARRRAAAFRDYLMKLFREVNRLDVGEDLLNTAIRRAADCMVWGGPAYAKRYGDTLLSVLSKDDRKYGYALTQAAAVGLAHVMLIKDEFYVAALLTRPERYLADHRKYAVNVRQGDRLSYRFLVHPRIKLWGRHFAFDWKARAWQLRLLARASFLRNYLKQHRLSERQWRDWVIEQVGGITIEGEQDYQRWVAVMEWPMRVRGFGELRLQRIREARRKMRELIDMKAEDYRPSGIREGSSDSPHVPLKVTISARPR